MPGDALMRSCYFFVGKRLYFAGQQLISTKKIFPNLKNFCTITGSLLYLHHRKEFSFHIRESAFFKGALPILIQGSLFFIKVLVSILYTLFGLFFGGFHCQASIIFT